MAPLASVISPLLVGRDAPLAAVDRLLSTLATSQRGPRVLVLRGEAGIGKSRLLGTLRERATEAGWRATESACFERYKEVPYALLSDLLHNSAGSLARVRELFGAEAELLTALPEFADGSKGHANDPQHAVQDSVQRQRRLFAIITGWFREAALDRPLLLLIEDLHWSDAASLSFLPILAQGLVDRAALLVVTLRTEDESPTLRATLAELNRPRLLAELVLARLNHEEVEAMVRACFQLDHPVDFDFVATLYSLTDGNPFFIEEVLTSLVSTGDIFYANGAWDCKPLEELQIPRSIQEAVTQRMALLSSEGREVLVLAAALGRRFDFAILHQVTGHDEATLLGLIKQLIVAQLIVEETADQFAFRHALGRAAVYGSLLARERRILHRRLGEALEQAGRLYLADLALHFAQAQLWEQALRYADAAAAAAWRTYAPHETLAHLTRALDAAARIPNSALAPLLHRRGQARALLDDFGAAQVDYEAALGEARRRGHTRDELQALLDLAELWSWRDYTRVQAYLDQVVTAARDLGEPVQLAQSLNQVGNWQLNLDRPQAAREAHREAYDIFCGLDDEHSAAETLAFLGVSSYLCGDLAQGTGYFQRAIPLFTAQDNRQGLVNSLVHLSLRAEFDTEVIDHEHLGARSSAVERSVSIAREIGWRAGETLALMNLGSHRIALGDYGEAQAALEASLTVAQEIAHRTWGVHAQTALGLLQLELLQAPEAVVRLTQALDQACALNSVLTVRHVARYLVTAYAQLGDVERADAVLRHPLVCFNDAQAHSLVSRNLSLARIELALARGEFERALVEVDLLIAATANRSTEIVPRLWLARGTAFGALRRHDAARDTLTAALAAAQRQGRRPLVWRAQVALAWVALGQKRRDEERAFAHAAHGLIDELARGLPDAHLREAFRARAYALIPDAATLTPRQALKQVFDGLTDRELEVARLIARGLTNRQIAETLTLSERTVSTHIGNIYGKLGFTARTQLIRWAIEKGISPT